MKKRPHDPEKFDSLRLLDAIARVRGLKINEPKDQVAILELLKDAISQTPKNKALVHGTRAETMFGYGASALGNCTIAKKEDAGELYSTIPDYRLLTLDGNEFFVEVKNCHKATVEYRYRLNRNYFATAAKLRIRLRRSLHGFCSGMETGIPARTKQRS